MKPWLWAITILFGVSLAAAAQEEGIPYERHLQVYWTDTPPVLDGRLDDDCWKEADVATDFRRLENKAQAAFPQTEVRVCYDAEYLYFFYYLYDDRIDKLEVGTPDDARDALDVNKDVVELFLDPGRSRSAYFQFCTTPLGARSDLRITPGNKREVGLYTPDWEVAPCIGNDHWAVEFRIPFAELVFDNSSIGSPRPGEEWGINFCRDQGYRKEWAFWSPTRDKSFHRPAQIGVAVFRGRKAGEQAPAIGWQESTLGYGSGTLSLKAAPGPAALSGSWELRRDRELQPSAGRAAGAAGTAFEYRITTGGWWDARVRVKAGGKTVFYGRTLHELPLVKSLIDTIQARVQAGLVTAAQQPGNPRIVALRGQLEELAALVAPFAAQLADPGKLANDQWQALAARVPEIEAKWLPVRYDIGLLALYPGKAGTEPLFAVATAGAYDRVYPDSILPPADKPVELWAAGRERESFQLVLMPFWRDIDDVKIAFSDLQGTTASIPASCFEPNVVGFVRMHESWGGHLTPDVLYPGKAFGLRKNNTQPIWINVLVPAGTPAGEYAGEITLAAGEWSRKVPVKVHAFGFDIPERRSISTDPWYWLAGGRELKDYYKTADVPFTPELYEKHLDMLSRYRYGCYPLSSDVMWKLVKIYLEKNGSLTFDFSGWDWIFELGRKYGADNLGASFGCNFNALRPTFSGRLPILDRVTGKEVSSPGKYAGTVAQWQYTHGVTQKSDFAANPVYRQYLVQLVEYLRGKGLLDNAHYEIYDEPKTGNEWQDVLRMHGFLKQFVPELKLKSYGVGPWHYENRPEWSPIGKYDAWAPGLHMITPERLEMLHERQAKGEVFWFYTCSAGYRDSNRSSTPHICLYQEPLAPRMHGWAAWKLRADGFLIFALDSGLGKEPKNTQADPEKFYSDPVWEAGKGAGQGYLVYPGPHQEYWPSIRLAAVRDGLEDYEFFHLLGECAGKLDKEKDADLIAGIQAELEIGDDILPWDWRGWCKDENTLRARRRRLAERLGQVAQLLATRPK